MPHTFGAHTGDKITFTAGDSITTNVAYLAWGWYLPTTLTAGRRLFSGGPTTGVQIDTTTSELHLITDGTTDDEYATTGTGLTTNQWSFVAVLGGRQGTSAVPAPRVWTGTVDTAPQAVAVSQTVAGSAFNASNSSITVGNTSNGSVSWQGDIAEFGIIIGQSSAKIAPWHLASAGAFADDEADRICRNFVLPAWEGKLRIPQYMGSASNVGFAFAHLMLNSNPIAVGGQVSDATTQPGLPLTLTGTTSVSQNGHPRGHSELMLQRRLARYW